MTSIITPSHSRTCNRWKPLPYVQILVGTKTNSWRPIYHHCDPWSIQYLSECFGGMTPVLFAGDHNAKHKDLYSRVSSPGGVLFRELASVNPCIVHRPHSPTTNPSCSTAMPDVLDIEVVKGFILPVNLTECSGLSSDHFPVKIDLRSRSSFPSLPDRVWLKLVDWTHLQDHLSHRVN